MDPSGGGEQPSAGRCAVVSLGACDTIGIASMGRRPAGTAIRSPETAAGSVDGCPLAAPAHFERIALMIGRDSHRARQDRRRTDNGERLR